MSLKRLPGFMVPIFCGMALLVMMGDLPGQQLQEKPAARKKGGFAKKGLLRKGSVKQQANNPQLSLDQLRINRDLEYAKIGERGLKLDLYQPKETASKLPVVVWIHGGGWRSGSKDRTPAVFLALGGFAVASVEYRLSGEAAFPAQIEDCKAAIRWLRANAKEYGLDPEHVGAWGSSAGGHLVALLGTAGDQETWVTDAQPRSNPEQSSRVQAVCDFYGPSNLTGIATSRTGAESPVSLLLGGSAQDKADLAKAASPITHVTLDDPPFLIVHGTEDTTVAMSQSEQLHEALKKAGVSSILLKVENAGHGFGPEGNPPLSVIQSRVRAFFEEHLKGREPKE